MNLIQKTPELSNEEKLNIFPELFNPEIMYVPDVLDAYRYRLSLISNDDNYRNYLIEELSASIRDIQSQKEALTSDMLELQQDDASLAVYQKELKMLSDKMSLKTSLLDRASCPKEFSSFLRNIETAQVSYRTQIKDRSYLSKMSNIFNKLYNNLDAQGDILFKLTGRCKALLSFEDKLIRNALDDKAQNSLKDIFAFRIVITESKNDSVEECYHVMEHVINFLEDNLCLLDTPTPMKDIAAEVSQENNRRFFKDYIAYPKSSGYQSLHALFITAVKKYNFELQIRNLDMHLTAEFGSAAHSGNYKESDKYQSIVPLIQMSGFKYFIDDNGLIKYIDEGGTLDSINVFEKRKTF